MSIETISSDQPVISFILPVYNAESYLRDCLQSLIRQTVKEIEIICVNDHSSDSSQALLENYAALDNRIIIISLPTRRGPGNARNIGIEHANGKYIRMVDADDFIPSNSSALLLEAAEEHASDFVKGGYEHCSQQGKPLKKGGYFPTALHPNISAETHYQLWHFDQHTTFLFQADILKKSAIRYNTEMFNGEDVIFLTELAPSMKRVTLIPETVYYYRNHGESTTRRKRDVQYFENIFATYHAVYIHRTAAGNINGLESADYYIFNRFTGMFSSSILPSMYSDLEENDLKEILHIFRSFLQQFDIFPRINTKPYPWKEQLILTKELVYLMTVLLNSDLDTATELFYYIAENKLGKRIGATREKALRRKLLLTRNALENIEASTFWRITAPFRGMIDAWRKQKKRITFYQMRLQEFVPEDIGRREKIYEKIYLANSWLSDESVSGRGSTLEQTKKIRQALPKIFVQYDIRTVVDVPCGDFYWMSTVDLSDIKYLGCDIVTELVRINEELYSRDNVSFSALNILEDPIKKADLIITRDCLLHFSYRDIYQALANFRNSKSTYLLATTFPDRKENADVEKGRRWRPLNLEAPPFNFPPPLLIINEAESSGRHQDKSLGLWKLSDLSDS